MSHVAIDQYSNLTWRRGDILQHIKKMDFSTKWSCFVIFDFLRDLFIYLYQRSDIVDYVSTIQVVKIVSDTITITKRSLQKSKETSKHFQNRSLAVSIHSSNEETEVSDVLHSCSRAVLEKKKILYTLYIHVHYDLAYMFDSEPIANHRMRFWIGPS